MHVCAGRETTGRHRRKRGSGNEEGDYRPIKGTGDYTKMRISGKFQSRRTEIWVKRAKYETSCRIPPTTEEHQTRERTSCLFEMRIEKSRGVKL